MTRYGYGDAGHQFTPDRHGRCQYAGSGYCDGTRRDTQHDERPATQPAAQLPGEVQPPPGSPDRPHPPEASPG